MTLGLECHVGLLKVIFIDCKVLLTSTWNYRTRIKQVKLIQQSHNHLTNLIITILNLQLFFEYSLPNLDK